MLLEHQELRQRADYTHKFNVPSGRHGWLRLTPAYSLKVVEEILKDKDDRGAVLDPFSGTATTGLSAAYHGHSSTCVEINPFLVWFGRAKVARYSREDVISFRNSASDAARSALAAGTELSVAPSIHNIERWWSQPELEFLCGLRIEMERVQFGAACIRDLLQVAFCRTLIKLSNAAFNHQSMSFKSAPQDDLLTEVEGKTKFAKIFLEDVEFVGQSAEDNPAGLCEIVEGDSRRLSGLLTRKFDLVITSPPYPNRMSYIRELRPYMYWLGFLENGRDAGELDWQKIGGTWGVATSRLTDWTPNRETYRPNYFQQMLVDVAAEANKNGQLLANYIDKYFEDIWLHLQGLCGVLGPQSEVHYIIGNSTFYGVLVPVERIYADMLSQLGFTNVSIRALRKRNSKKELVEFDVSGVFGALA